MKLRVTDGLARLIAATVSKPALAAALFCSSLCQAQEVTTLIPFTNIWKYDQSGLDLRTAWRTNDFDDASWASGPGLLGLESDTPGVYTVHSPISTPLTISSTVTTYYFRTTFTFAGTTNGLSLVASNLVDDGFVAYLNGREVGRARVQQLQTAATLANNVPPSGEGFLEAMSITNLSLLRQGENLVAVEVHQSGPASSDVMWGMKLMAIQQTALLITNQPQSQTVLFGDSATFSVGVSGGPAFYQWQRNGFNVPNGTSSQYSLSGINNNNAGEYRVIVTNSISSVTSSVAILTVIPDRVGPTLIAAIVNNRPEGTGVPFGSNTINVFFSEVLNPPSATETNNFSLRLLGSTHIIPIKDVLYSAALGALLYVDDANTNWISGADYVLTVNNVRDRSGNVIAPDSQIGVSWFFLTNLLSPGAVWSFHSAAASEPDIYDQPWSATNFVESSLWAQGQGAFCSGTLAGPPCVQDCQSEIGYQSEPSLFRTTFVWPAEFSSNATLHIAAAFDDGLALYLNGREIYRENLPAGSGPLTSGTRAAARTIAPICNTNINVLVTNHLLPGTNWLAVGVVQSGQVVGDADVVFGLRLNATVLLAPSLPVDPLPTLYITSLNTNAARLSWTGSGYALESVTNLTGNSASYPLGPWQQVTNMANPYTVRLDEPSRFFRLKK